MSAATAGLIGALIGGVLTAGSTFGIEAWRSWRSRKSEDARREKELRQVARLVVEELAAIADVIEDAAQHGTWWASPRQLPTATWTENRGFLAAELEPMEWRLAAQAFQELTG